MMSRRAPLPATAPIALRALAPVVICLLIAGWVLWGRADPSRQGGYCANATVVIGESLRRSDTPTATARGPFPDLGRLVGTAGTIDVGRLQVSTPPELRADVALLVARGPRSKAEEPKPDPEEAAAFARVAADYLQRCRGETDTSD